LKPDLIVRLTFRAYIHSVKVDMHALSLHSPSLTSTMWSAITLLHNAHWLASAPSWNLLLDAV
jgi:hypothetical protein